MRLRLECCKQDTQSQYILRLPVAFFVSISKGRTVVGAYHEITGGSFIKVMVKDFLQLNYFKCPGDAIGKFQISGIVFALFLSKKILVPILDR